MNTKNKELEGSRPALSDLLGVDLPLTLKGLSAPDRQQVLRAAQSRLEHVPGNLALIDALMSFHEQMESIPEWEALRVEPSQGTVGLSLHWLPKGWDEDRGEWLSLDTGPEMFLREARLYEMEIDAEIVDHIFNASHEITWLSNDPQALAAVEKMGPRDFTRSEVANPAPMVFQEMERAIRAWEAAVDMESALPEPTTAPARRRRP